ncbi:radical SAM protein [Armatimonas rosea]|uniref:MoaA/NifB/PqqE/SkfB family radical SAM enzyme n=1 Tax=Armatimonas rosea TaxID=685828 RepID=A0A7W9STG2_ARMRO|nr:MoaA/NifB/PqqE/SkfB family radical SAM enzyme [Armatimonas rosea]
MSEARGQQDAPLPRGRSQGRLEETRLNLLPTLGPQSVSIVLTNACNLRCLTCWSYSPLRKELPMAEWRRKRLGRELLGPLFAELAGLGTERVIFTGGGDPLAHPECLEVFADAKSAGLKVTLISNLTLVRDRVRFLALGLNTILANFSCADPETYVAFHPGRSAADFHVLIALLRQVVAAGTQLKLVFVVCAVNCHVLAKALTLAKALGASVQFKLMSATDETQSLVLSEPQRSALVAQRPELEAIGASANLDAFYTELSGSAPDRFPIDEVGCFAGHWYARVDGDANVRFCCNPSSELTLGNLNAASFTELWRSQAWHALRTRLRSGDFLPGCERCGKFDLNLKVKKQLEK